MQNPIIDFSNFSFQYRAQSNPTLIDINLKINSVGVYVYKIVTSSGEAQTGKIAVF